MKLVVRTKINFGVKLPLDVMLMVNNVVTKKEVNGVLIYRSVLSMMKNAVKIRHSSGAKILQHVI